MLPVLLPCCGKGKFQRLEIAHAPYAVVVLLLAQVTVRMQADFVADVSSDIEWTLECRHMVGLSVAIVRGNETLLAKGYGMADVANAIPMTADTPMALGSVGKAFTVEILAQLLVEDQEHGYDENWRNVRHTTGGPFY